MGLSLIHTARELWKFGTQERVARGTPLVLHGHVTGNVAGARYSTLRLAGAAAGYVVTAGKTLLVTRVMYQHLNATNYWVFGYSDADLGMDAAADGANPVFLDGTSPGAGNVLRPTAVAVIYDASVYYEIPAGKYPRVAEDAGANYGLYSFFCHEV